jgi:hypothetical protein
MRQKIATIWLELDFTNSELSLRSPLTVHSMKKHLLALTCAISAAIGSLASADSVAYPQVAHPDFVEQFPFSMVGQLIFTSGGADYQGSGTTVYKRSVLTAAHNCWDIDNGWSTNIEFNRARVGTPTPNQYFARRVYVFGGYQSAARANSPDSVMAFASDLGGLRFPTALAGGNYAGWRADTSLLTGDTYNIALGYGADQHSGDEMLYVEPDFAFAPVFGAFFESEHLTFEGGMSGGPVFAAIGDNDLRVAGIIVAGSDTPPSGGIRALNSAAARFLQTYLRY